MPAKKTSVSSPLQLLQQLSLSLVDHLEKACRQAQSDAEATLAKLEKQRAKAEDKLRKAYAKREEAGAAAKPKAQAKAQASVDELEGVLTALHARREETVSYIATLRRDSDRAMSLASGITQVAEAAGKAGTDDRGSVAATRKPAPSARKNTGKPAVAKVAKPAAVAGNRPATADASTAKKPSPGVKPAAQSKAPAASKPVGKTPAAPRPAGKRAATDAPAKPVGKAPAKPAPVVATTKAPATRPATKQPATPKTGQPGKAPRKPAASKANGQTSPTS